MRLSLPDALRRQIIAAAAAAAPGECCGLILGHAGLDAAALALHPARNLSEDFHRFEIAADDHFAAQRLARACGMTVIGCYHSHPGGAAAPSPTDLAGAAQQDFLWLIAAPLNQDWTMAAFVYRGSELLGADLVTSSS